MNAVANLHRSSVDGSELVINVAYRSDAVVGRSDVAEGRPTYVTEPEWSGEVVEYNVAYRGMILSDRSNVVDIHVHDTTKQDQSLHYIVYGRSKNLANRQRT